MRFRNWEAVHLGGSGSGFSHLRLWEPLQAGRLTWQLAGGPTSSSYGPLLECPRNTQLASSREMIPERKVEAAVLFMTCSGKPHTCHILLVRNELLRGELRYCPLKRSILNHFVNMHLKPLHSSYTGGWEDWGSRPALLLALLRDTEDELNSPNLCFV